MNRRKVTITLSIREYKSLKRLPPYMVWYQEKPGRRTDALYRNDVAMNTEIIKRLIKAYENNKVCL